jgi:hypothetical protein
MLNAYCSIETRQHVSYCSLRERGYPHTNEVAVAGGILAPMHLL